MNTPLKEKAKVAAKVAVQAARIMLIAAEDIPTFGSVAKLINKIIQVCDQSKCNKDASKALQERFCRLAEHLFSGPQGLATIANSRPNNAAMAVFCDRMEGILHVGIAELERFTKGGFVMSILKGSKPQEAFEILDKEMTQCLNELSVVLHVTALNEQAQIYDVVCNIQARVDERGGLEGLIADPVQLESLAQEIGADVGDLKAEVLHVLASLGTQVSVVDENVKEMKAKVDAVHQAVVQMQKTTAAPDMTALQLTSPPVVDRSQVLGEGAFGKVYKGVYNHMDVAVKEVSIAAAKDKGFLREVAMHYKVGNLPGVVRIFGANLTSLPRYIVMELAMGTLHDALHKGWPEIDRALPSKLSLLAQVCTTMAAISDMGILHRDLKSSNVLLFFHNERVYAKISDFGLTKMENESTINSTGTSPKGTLPYMAPELFRNQYSSASDMYAFAVLLNEVLMEQVPFPGRSYVEIVQSVGTYRHRPDRYKADATDTLGCELMRCIERCWHQDPALRMSFHELAAELNHLLRKAAEAARVGNQASPLTPPRPPTKEIEDSITALVDWLTSSCHLAETDAMPLAHTLVTVKRITSVPVLEQVMQRAPDFLSRELNVSAVHDAKICTTLGIHAKPISTSSVKLQSLNCAELCQLFEHCLLFDLNDFILQNKLKGMHLTDAIETIQDLVGLGLDFMTAKVLYKRITDWKQYGLPEDFHPTRPVSTADAPHSEPLPPVPVVTDKELDDDYIAARFCGGLAATDRILAAAECDNHLAEAYYSVLCSSGGGFVTRNKIKATEYAKRALPWLVDNASNGNMYAQFNLAMCYGEERGVDKDEAEAVRLYKLAADQGHAGALFRLGACYANGTGVTQDWEEAMRYYNLAADEGHAGAQYILGTHYTDGSGVTKDETEAMRCFTLAADQGHTGALCYLGGCYANGAGVVKDEEEAVRYYQLSAGLGYVFAQYNLAACYSYGRGVTKDKRAAFSYYQQAADRGHADAQYCVARSYAEATGVARNDREAVRYYHMAALQNHADAQFHLGVCYANGTGVNKHEIEAMWYLKLAADQGHAEAQYKTAVCYANGTGTAQDLEQAVKYYKLAALQGHTEAQFAVGVCFANGTGVARSDREAVGLYSIAAEQGHANAQFHLGVCYAHGTGVAKNPEEAVKNYNLAADQGHADAQYALGVCYKHGTGVPIDKKEAKNYFKLAADKDHASAKKALNKGVFSKLFK